MNFGMIAISGVFYILVLTTAISPSFQSIQDWSRYQGKRTWKEWFLGERSPAIWAIAANIVIGILPVILTGLVMVESQYYFVFTIGLVMQGLMAMIFASIGMNFLLSRHRKRGIFAAVIVLSAMFAPMIIFAFAAINPEFHPAPWLWTISPVVVTQFTGTGTLLLNLLGQLGAIAVFHQMIQQRLRKIGHSELKQQLAAAPNS